MLVPFVPSHTLISYPKRQLHQRVLQDSPEQASMGFESDRAGDTSK